MSTVAVAAAFAAGLTTGVGPCVAPRYLALTAIAARTTGRARWVRVGLFAAGLLMCYVLLATTASLVVAVTAFSRVVYLALAVGFLGFGLHLLVARTTCAGAHVEPSRGVSFLSGGALGLVLSPCCTPMVAMTASVGIASGSIATSLVNAAAFAAGHIAPLATIGLGLGAAERWAPIRMLSGAAQTISGGLSIALAAYYGLLA
jgi:cytochrome c-type biogenesis protein